jgi:hypothetical protein
MNADNEREGVRIGAEIARNRADLSIKNRQVNKPQPKSKGD